MTYPYNSEASTLTFFTVNLCRSFHLIKMSEYEKYNPRNLFSYLHVEVYFSSCQAFRFHHIVKMMKETDCFTRQRDTSKNKLKFLLYLLGNISMNKKKISIQFYWWEFWLNVNHNLLIQFLKKSTTGGGEGSSKNHNVWYQTEGGEVQTYWMFITLYLNSS